MGLFCEEQEMELIETVKHNGLMLALIIRAQFATDETTFVTPPEYAQQVGFVVYAKGSVIPRHRHLPVKREVIGTSEVILVRRGKCEVNLYPPDGTTTIVRRLSEGDVLVLVSGAHSFRMLDDTVLLEVKQGPYLGDYEKERF